jgi:hypothetical protein
MEGGAEKMSEFEKHFQPTKKTGIERVDYITEQIYLSKRDGWIAAKKHDYNLLIHILNEGDMQAVIEKLAEEIEELELNDNSTSISNDSQE